MYRHPSYRRIDPKLSAIPRAKSEAAAFLDCYKLMIEKKRLHQELERIERRQQQILDRLVALEAQVFDLEQTTDHQRQASLILPQTSTVTPKQSPASSASEPFDVLFLPY
jgi:hypothetical protein